MAKPVSSSDITQRNGYLEEHPQVSNMPRDFREWHAFIQALQRWHIQYEGELSLENTVEFSDSPTFTAKYFRHGKIISLRFGNVTGSSDQVTFSLTAFLPAHLRPALQQTVLMPGLVDNGTTQTGYARIQTNGTINFALSYNESGFTASGTKGISGNGYTISYALHDTDRIT